MELLAQATYSLILAFYGPAPVMYGNAIFSYKGKVHLSQQTA